MLSKAARSLSGFLVALNIKMLTGPLATQCFGAFLTHPPTHLFLLVKGTTLIEGTPASAGTTNNRSANTVPIWEGVVHVFDLAGNPKATRAYAWSSPIEGSTKRRFFAVLHIPPITSPVDAVRAAIVAEHKTRTP